MKPKSCSVYRCFLIAVLGLCGCARYKPKSYIPPGTLKAQYLEDLTSKTLIKDYESMKSPTPDPDTAEAKAERQLKVERRNQILREMISLVDTNYSSFEDRYYGSDATINFGGDVVNLALTGVSSVTGTAHLKSVLSAVATGTTGMKTSYLKNYYDQQTRAAVVQKMRANRAKQLALMEDEDHMKAPAICPAQGCPEVTVDGKKHTVAPYSLESGLNDIEQYYQAGTIIGALQAIAASAGDDQTKAAEKKNKSSAAPQLY